MFLLFNITLFLFTQAPFTSSVRYLTPTIERLTPLLVCLLKKQARNDS